MAIIGLILAILGGIGFWWWRAQQVGDAAGSVIDAAGKARGMISRARFRQRAGTSVLAGVDSPGMAAATLVYSLMSLKRPVGLSDEDKIDAMLETVCRIPEKERGDAMAFAAWASGQVADTNEIVRRFLPLWQDGAQPAAAAGPGQHGAGGCRTWRTANRCAGGGHQAAERGPAALAFPALTYSWPMTKAQILLPSRSRK